MARPFGSKNRVSRQIEMKCLCCGKVFMVYPYRKNTAKYCSYSCNAKMQEITPQMRKKFSENGKRLWREGKLKCPGGWNKGKKGLQTAWNKGLKGYLAGKKHYNWKGGITPKNRAVRAKAAWRTWRDKVFKRDNYTCQKCGNKSGKNFDKNIYLEPHHIFPINKLLKHKFEHHIYNVDNGLTLCRGCHKFTYKNNF